MLCSVLSLSIIQVCAVFSNMFVNLLVLGIVCAGLNLFRTVQEILESLFNYKLLVLYALVWKKFQPIA